MNDYNPIISIGTAVALLQDVFGQPVYYIPGISNDAEPDMSYIMSVASADEYDRLSQFGTPVVGTFTTRGGKYKVYDKNGKLESKEYSDFEFPLATIVDFSRNKNIAKTPTIGSSGTVKEIFGFEDWKINIRGICLNDPSRKSHKTAQEQLDYLIFLNEIADSIEILQGKILLDKKITRIAIESLNITAVQGKPGMMQFEIECSSDEDFLIVGV